MTEIEWNHKAGYAVVLPERDSLDELVLWAWEKAADARRWAEQNLTDREWRIARVAVPLPEEPQP